MKKLTQDEFIEKCNLKHNHKYDYSNTIYTNKRTSVIVYCPTHKEDFTVNPKSHWMDGTGCPKCLNDNRLLKYLKNAAIVHGNKYDYSLAKFKHGKFKIKIICPLHGIFEQDPWNHLNGQGCQDCALLSTGYSYTNFKNACQKNNKGFGIFYIIRCFDGNESFYKMGITSKSIKERYDSKKRMPYQYEIIQEILSSPDVIWQFEKFLKQYTLQNNIRYIPLIYFCGQQTECYQI